jgi:hypothetical protein
LNLVKIRVPSEPGIGNGKRRGIVLNISNGIIGSKGISAGVSSEGIPIGGKALLGILLGEVISIGEFSSEGLSIGWGCLFLTGEPTGSRSL